MRSPPPRLVKFAAAAVLVAGGVAIVYREAALAYFLNDDFHWLAEARRFEWANLARLGRYDHFYRPVIEIYFYLGQGLAGCAAFPFHLASIGIHLLNTLVLFTFARRLTSSLRFASLSVLLFVVQPGYTEAVAWVAAITDLLPALWYLLALLLHLVFLQTRGGWAYAGSLAAFIACLLTHESSATLLPMMIALETLLMLEGGIGSRPVMKDWAARYAPFAVFLALFLVAAYVVNSRSYLVRDGYYAFGSHAFLNALHYIVALYVGKRSLIDYVLIAATIGAVLLRGTFRMRFFIVWILVTLLPVLFFTWGIASRYLYVPAAGFALLLADLLMASEGFLARWVPARAVRTSTAVVSLALAVRFGVFAQKGAEDFRERTQPYVRLAAAFVASDADASPDRTVYVDRQIAEAVPALYLQPAAETVFCARDVQVTIR